MANALRARKAGMAFDRRRSVQSSGSPGLLIGIRSDGSKGNLGFWSEQIDVCSPPPSNQEPAHAAPHDHEDARSLPIYEAAAKLLYRALRNIVATVDAGPGLQRRIAPFRDYRRHPLQQGGRLILHEKLCHDQCVDTVEIELLSSSMCSERGSDKSAKADIFR